MSVKRFVLLAVATTLALVPSVVDAAASPAPEKVAPTTSTKYVDVSVASVWTDPSSPRHNVDDLAISKTPDPGKWVQSMTNQQKLDLEPLMQTQGLYGAKVTVDETKTVEGTSWDHVWVDKQPSPFDPKHPIPPNAAKGGGYPGWIPAHQLTSEHALNIGKSARIATRTAWSYRSPIAAISRDFNQKGTEFSFNTSFPVVGRTASWTVVMDNHNKPLFFNSADLAKVPTHSPTGQQIVREARKFLGLPYLWSGTSGFGFDCSGFTNQIYSFFGVVIPRDAEPQFDAGAKDKVSPGSVSGTRVTKMAELHAGDTVGFRNKAGDLHHIGIFTGITNGHPMMIDSPDTGSVVREEPLDSPHRLEEFAGATRFIDN